MSTVIMSTVCLTLGEVKKKIVFVYNFIQHFLMLSELLHGTGSNVSLNGVQGSVGIQNGHHFRGSSLINMVFLTCVELGV